MNLKDKLINAFLGGVIESKVKDRLKAASFLDSPNIEDLKWRRLTGNANRELIPTTQDRMIEIAYWLYQTNSLAGWLIDITTAFIMAEELPYESKDEDVKAVLDGFWNDSINRMDLYLPKHVSELHIFGELCMPAFVAEQTGRVRLGYVDPAQIGVVVTDPENVKMQIGLLTKGWIGEVAGYQINQEPKNIRSSFRRKLITFSPLRPKRCALNSRMGIVFISPSITSPIRQEAGHPCSRSATGSMLTNNIFSISPISGLCRTPSSGTF